MNAATHEDPLFRDHMVSHEVIASLIGSLVFADRAWPGGDNWRLSYAYATFAPSLKRRSGCRSHFGIRTTIDTFRLPFGFGWAPSLAHIAVDEIAKRAIGAGYAMTHYLDSLHYFGLTLDKCLAAAPMERDALENAGEREDLGETADEQTEPDDAADQYDEPPQAYEDSDFEAAIDDTEDQVVKRRCDRINDAVQKRLAGSFERLVDGRARQVRDVGSPHLSAHAPKPMSWDDRNQAGPSQARPDQDCGCSRASTATWVFGGRAACQLLQLRPAGALRRLLSSPCRAFDLRQCAPSRACLPLPRPPLSLAPPPPQRAPCFAPDRVPLAAATRRVAVEIVATPCRTAVRTYSHAHACSPRAQARTRLALAPALELNPNPTPATNPAHAPI
jgi:hypothetical protein